MVCGSISSSNICSASGISSTSAACASASALAAASAASRAAISSSSFFDLRPRFLGAGFSSIGSSIGASTSCFSCCLASAASASANKESREGFFSLVFFVAFASRFSPSVPLTVYTLLLSFLAIRVRFRLVVPPLAAESSAALSRIA